MSREGKEQLNIEIRRYELNDKEKVFELHKKALDAIGSYIPGKNEQVDGDFDDIENIYLKGGGEFLVGTVGEKIVAIGAIKKLSPEIGEIKRIRTDPDFQRLGFAQAILSRLEARAKELGFKSLELDTWITQTASHALYEKNGFQEYKREMGKVSGVENIFYRKIL